ncbi:ARM repeat-containing protein [Paxillus ammoniavirescens]|nr:ARM repeat-containing protein [Paxillus ammoniavirescens]
MKSRMMFPQAARKTKTMKKITSLGARTMPRMNGQAWVTTSKELQPQPAGRYIPPGLRKQAEGTDKTQEDVEKLTRQLKGLINRMSEQNMSTVLDGMEEIYRKHRRHDVTSSLTTLIIDGISSHAMLLDSFVVLHAAFISSMHKLIGIEFAAFVVQNIVFSYERHLQNYESDVPNASDKPEDRGKESSNLIVLLSELYNFQVISCILLYDIVRDLLSKELSEFRVELLLKILRNSGQQLRQDDPSALKDIVALAQSSIAKKGDDLSTRTKFMIETLTNLKNNKIKKSATQHQGGDAVERMKKFLTGLGKKRHVQAHEPLRVSLDDLRSAETKGKWWLVGAAWGGDPLVDQQHEASTKRTEASAEDISDTALVKLARKQGMNTDIRRSIFVVLMSSDDYLDACERLAQLNLSEVQQREIVRVILHCCGNEKSYNPYYSLVCQQLCQTSHSYKITLQFCLWDFLRDLGETSVGGAEVIKHLKDENVQFEVKNISSSRMKNVAKAYGWWMSKDCCSLTILKPVDFTLLKPQARKFLKELIVQIFVASQASSPLLTNSSKEQSSRNRGTVEEIFMKATKVENLGLGLIFFLSHAFKGEEGLVKWASTVARETLQTGMNEIPRL